MKYKKQFLIALSIATATVGVSGHSVFAKDRALPKMKTIGDMRFRVSDDADNGAGNNRIRMRMRYGIDATANADTDAAFGFSSGSTDGRSSNQTLSNFFERTDVRLDYAYIKVRNGESLEQIFGQMKNPFFTVSEFLWDADLRPSGIFAKYKYDKEVSLGMGIFSLLSLKTTFGKEPFFYAIQPTWVHEISDGLNAKVGATYYGIQNLTGTPILGVDGKPTKGTNSRDTSGNITAKFSEVAFTGELSFDEFFGKPFRLYTETVVNIGETTKNKGALVGFGFGNRAIKKAGDWSFNAQYRYMQQNGWLEQFSDADAYRGETDTKGFELLLQYGLLDNLEFGIDYYVMDAINRASKPSNVVQFDLTAKF